MRRLLRLEASEFVLQPESRRIPKRKNFFVGLGLGLSKNRKMGQSQNRTMRRM